ncbi:hypothetical protein F4777DRAFT_601598 [Nemania sp. FL0916]|nr:hypothetical protein F4777DRAFT_601598 [Nemania sp. FL0916]
MDPSAANQESEYDYSRLDPVREYLMGLPQPNYSLEAGSTTMPDLPNGLQVTEEVINLDDFFDFDRYFNVDHLDAQQDAHRDGVEAASTAPATTSSGPQVNREVIDLERYPSPGPQEGDHQDVVEAEPAPAPTATPAIVPKPNEAATVPLDESTKSQQGPEDGPLPEQPAAAAAPRRQTRGRKRSGPGRSGPKPPRKVWGLNAKEMAGEDVIREAMGGRISRRRPNTHRGVAAMPPQYLQQALAPMPLMPLSQNAVMPMMPMPLSQDARVPMMPLPLPPNGQLYQPGMTPNQFFPCQPCQPCQPLQLGQGVNYPQSVNYYPQGIVYQQPTTYNQPNTPGQQPAANQQGTINPQAVFPNPPFRPS